MILVQILLLAIGFLMLVKGADWFVDGSAGIAKKLGIPQLVIGLTIVAMGTSAPEAAVSINASLKANSGIAIGNVVGSNIFNILFVIGTAALISPVLYDPAFLFDGIIAVLAGVLLWVSVLKTKSLRKPWGIVFLLCYGAYLVNLMV